MGRKALGILVGAALLAAPALAREQAEIGDTAVIARFGVGTYTGELSDFTRAGPSWGVVLNLQPWNVLGLEVGYDGSRNELTDDRIRGTSAVSRHGGTALLKLGLPFIERIKPFVGAGLGVSYASISGDDEGPFQGDLLEEIPLVAGLEFNTGYFTAGFRAGYRFLIDEAFADGAAPGNPQGGIFDAQLAVGARF